MNSQYSRFLTAVSKNIALSLTPSRVQLPKLERDGETGLCLHYEQLAGDVTSDNK
jgi:hypothetical protein